MSKFDFSGKIRIGNTGKVIPKEIKEKIRTTILKKSKQKYGKGKNDE